MDTINIPTPHIPFGPKGIPAPVADARYLREAADHLEHGYPVGGSNLTATVLKLLRDAADAIEAADKKARKSAQRADMDAEYDDTNPGGW